MAIWMSYSSATVRLVSMTAGVVPQSSWSFRPQAPASICFRSGFGRLPLPLPRMPTLIGRPSNAWSIRMMFHAPGVQVVAQVPVAEPVPPPINVVMPEAMAVSICCGQMKWMWVSIPPAVTILPSPAMISVPGPMTSRGSTPFWVKRIAGLADGHDPAGTNADVALDDPPVVDDHRVGDDQVAVIRAHRLLERALILPVPDRLAAAEDGLLAVVGVVVLDLDDQFGVGQPDAVADRRAVLLGVGLPRNFERSWVDVHFQVEGRIRSCK